MKAITYPFKIDANGKIADTTDSHKIWLDRVRSVINTQVGDRAMRPTFGMDSDSVLFSTGATNEQVLISSIKTAFVTFLPSLSLEEVTTVTELDSQTITATVLFTYPDNTTTSTDVVFADGSVTSTTDYSEGLPQ